jgi:hypothetical protein
MEKRVPLLRISVKQKVNEKNSSLEKTSFFIRLKDKYLILVWFFCQFGQTAPFRTISFNFLTRNNHFVKHGTSRNKQFIPQNDGIRFAQIQ